MRGTIGSVAAILVLAVAAITGYGAYRASVDSQVTNFDDQPPSRALAVKDGVVPQVGFFKSPDGLALRYASFAPAAAAHDTIALIPGKSDTIEDYQDLIDAYVDAGYHVLSFDLRSQGLSGRTLTNTQKIHVATFDLYVGDIKQFIDQVVKPQQQGSLTVVAHSMGGGAVALGLASESLHLDRVVLLAPMFQALELPLDGPKGYFIRALAAVETLTFNRTEYFVTSGDWDPGSNTAESNKWTVYPAGLNRSLDNWKKEPRIVTGGVTSAWIHAYYTAMDSLNAVPDQSLATPTRLILPELDTMNSNDAAERFCRQKMTSCSFEALSGQKHDLALASPDVLRSIVASTTRFVSNVPPK